MKLGNGDGTFRKGSRFGHFSSYAFGVVVGDFNRDGNLDVVSVTSPDTLSVFIGQGDGNFKHLRDYNYSSARGTPFEVLSADLNGDGILDLVAFVGTDGVYTQLGNGDGTFQRPRRVVSNQHIGCNFGPGGMVSDFNGDGNADLAFCERDQNSGKLWIALGNGDGTFRKPVSLFVSAQQGAFSFTAGDFNSDGKTDLVANYFTSGKFNQTETDLFLGNGDGTFQPKKVITLPGEPFYNAEDGIVPADFNSDGLLDFIFQQPGDVAVFVQK